MLEKQELSARPKNSKDLAQGSFDAVNAAQRECADYTIERAILQRQLFAAQQPLLNLSARLLDPPLRQPVHARIRIDRRDLSHRRGIVRQVQPTAETDLQHFAACGLKHLFPLLRHQRRVKDEVANPRKDHPRIKAHAYVRLDGNWRMAAASIIQ